MSSTYEVGKAMTLTYEVRDENGALTNATVALAVTLPDGTVETFTGLTPVSLGVYEQVFVPTLNGLHQRRWTATGAVTDALTDTFTVGGILSLDEAKAQLTKDSTKTLDDDELQTYIDAVTEALEAEYGPIAVRTITEWFTHPRHQIVLSEERVIAVSSVTGYIGTAATSYTLAADPTVATDTTYYLADGILDRAAWPPRVKVIYTAGLPVVPQSVNTAARLLVQALWRSQNGRARTADGQSLEEVLAASLQSPAVQMLLSPLGGRMPRIA